MARWPSTRTSWRPGVFSRVRNSLINLSTDWWLIELLSLLLAYACIAITASILASHDNKPLPESTPFDLSLNAFLSILSGICKLALAVPLEEALGSQKYLWQVTEQFYDVLEANSGALIVCTLDLTNGIAGFSTAHTQRSLMDFERFDDAARGPLGAARLLSRTHTKSLATIGGIACILSLALDPFFQQLIALPKRDSLENRSRVPRVVHYHYKSVQINNGTEGLGWNAAGMNAAVATFFLDQSTPVSTPAFCSSEQCLWPVFTTLQLCSRCEDVSDMLDFGCTREAGHWRQEYLDVVKGVRPLDLNRTSCGWFLNMTDENPTLMTGYSSVEDSSELKDKALIMRIFNLRDVRTDALYWNGNLKFESVSAPMSNFIIVASRDLPSLYRNETPEAHSCVMEWCTKTIEASYTNGMLSERILSTWTNQTKFLDPLNVTLEDGVATDYIYTRNITLTPPDQADTFIVSNLSAVSTRFAFDYWVPSFLTYTNLSSSPMLRYANSDGDYTTCEPTNAVTPWISTGRVAETVENIAKAMSDALRANGLYAENVLGSGSPKIFVDVRWSWFAFPLCLLGLTTVFLFATMWQMSAHPRVWKSSSLTVLVHGLSWDAKAAFRNVKSMRGIREQSSQMQVFLNVDKEGGTLDVHSDHSSNVSWDDTFVRRYMVHMQRKALQ